jgi:DNA-binding response OmpR family regulator
MVEGIENDATVLVVDDEPDVADVYALRLRGRFDTRTAYGGREALEAVDDEVDVVLLDRRMPVVSGDEVLETIRDREVDPAVVMVTAVTPDLTVLDMPFDDYLCKPIDRESLVETVEKQLETAAHDEVLDEFFRLASKLILLDQERSRTELADSEEFQRVKRRTVELREQLRAEMDDFERVAQRFLDLNRIERA